MAIALSVVMLAFLFIPIGMALVAAVREGLAARNRPAARKGPVVPAGEPPDLASPGDGSHRTG